MGTGLMGMFRDRGPRMQRTAVIRPVRASCLTFSPEVCAFAGVLISLTSFLFYCQPKIKYG